jgi:hypothetical protein
LSFFVASVFGIFIRAFRVMRGQTIFIPLRQFQSSLAVTIFIESGAWWEEKSLANASGWDRTDY